MMSLKLESFLNSFDGTILRGEGLELQDGLVSVASEGDHPVSLGLVALLESLGFFKVLLLV